MKSEDVAPLTNLLVEKMRAEVTERYKRAMATKAFKVQDVGAGRGYMQRTGLSPPSTTHRPRLITTA
ncbi:MAG: hypothetical protein A3I01_11855 [Betaproteobacteria bacterium RIFCSPLOWO2_02_FULL_65_24]|nr:MAG: hypothetical protein A3I01_11855 [Betaproteobacteria bacterium RIFCSPLOWO2_02_FULL_65_24]